MTIQIFNEILNIINNDESKFEISNYDYIYVVIACIKDLDRQSKDKIKKQLKKRKLDNNLGDNFDYIDTILKEIINSDDSEPKKQLISKL